MAGQGNKSSRYTAKWQHIHTNGYCFNIMEYQIIKNSAEPNHKPMGDPKGTGERPEVATSNYHDSTNAKTEALGQSSSIGLPIDTVGSSPGTSGDCNALLPAKSKDVRPPSLEALYETGMIDLPRSVIASNNRPDYNQEALYQASTVALPMEVIHNQSLPSVEHGGVLPACSHGNDQKNHLNRMYEQSTIALPVTMLDSAQSGVDKVARMAGTPQDSPLLETKNDVHGDIMINYPVSGNRPMGAS